MGFWLFLILVILILAGGWFYRRLLDIERDIRREMAEEQGAVANRGEVPTLEEAPEIRSQEPPEMADVERRIQDIVSAESGLLQTELYDRIADLPRRKLQQLLRSMEGEGRLRREKEKGRYRLYPSG
ncbi:hypothetical protein C2E25_04760 [Geothermobacter hydrogeniphilus]|uniref:Uncharacterized protein n=1 Tax=Geothermobacter hydrogeniphilus TaxID=1969733 RepID=A0A2K2HC78_9BACT|nr:hypothetical protein [Geothermobacter hydrogeniphilus]PNU20904.1 hypothetical protein C2E25_04760 [Geothermobacter hydrogeniphilus]